MDPPSRELLADLLLDWEDAFRSGREMSAAELAHNRPDLIEHLDRRIRVLKATAWIDNPKDSSEPTHDPAPPGGRLLGGRYRLEQRIGVGGFAEVWQGFDTELERVVAVKIPKASRIAMQDAFLAEARRVARLRHPAIVAVHDVGTDGDECFIISELMDGGSLADRLAVGPIPLPAAIRWIGQIAEALDFAHRSGLIHRDVKPANILINHHGDAVLTDFGIAQSEKSSGQFAPSVGTLRYMAPEQLAGAAIGPTADLYSLGIVLYEAVVGAKPHPSRFAPSFCHEVIGRSEKALAVTLPPGLADICLRALDRDPTRRPPTAAAFAAGLRAAAVPVAPLRYSRRLALALAAMALAVAACLTLVGKRPAAKPLTNQPSAPRLVTPATSPPAPLRNEDGTPIKSLTFLRIEDALPYIVETRDVGRYREWQDVPTTYIGPLANDAECTVTFRFDFPSPTVRAQLIAEARCWDFTREPGGIGRGTAALDISRDGDDWVAIRDTIKGREWGRGWVINEPLPAEALGGRSLWIRARLLTNGSLNAGYSVAQFGRNREDQSQPTFGIVAELLPEVEPAAGSR